MASSTIEELTVLESAARRIEDLAAHPSMSESGRGVISWAASELLNAVDSITPGPSAQLAAGDDVDVDAAINAFAAFIADITAHFISPSADGFTETDCLLVAMAFDDTSSLADSPAN